MRILLFDHRPLTDKLWISTNNTHCFIRPSSFPVNMDIPHILMHWIHSQYKSAVSPLELICFRSFSTLKGVPKAVCSLSERYEKEGKSNTLLYNILKSPIKIKSCRLYTRLTLPISSLNFCPYFVNYFYRCISILFPLTFIMLTIWLSLSIVWGRSLFDISGQVFGSAPIFTTLVVIILADLSSGKLIGV
jgi:hypothetical protein